MNFHSSGKSLCLLIFNQVNLFFWLCKTEKASTEEISGFEGQELKGEMRKSPKVTAKGDQVRFYKRKVFVHLCMKFIINFVTLVTPSGIKNI